VKIQIPLDFVFDKESFFSRPGSFRRIPSNTM
jgi:hypothetical protein